MADTVFIRETLGDWGFISDDVVFAFGWAVEQGHELGERISRYPLCASRGQPGLMHPTDPVRPKQRPERLTRDINADTPFPKNLKVDPEHKPGSEAEYNHDKFDAADLLDNVIDMLDGEIDLLRT